MSWLLSPNSARKITPKLTKTASIGERPTLPGTRSCTGWGQPSPGSPPAIHTVAPLPPHREAALRWRHDERAGESDGDLRGHAEGPHGRDHRRGRRLPAGGADDDLL